MAKHCLEWCIAALAIASLLCGAMTLQGCSVISLSDPPYVISKPVSIAGCRSGYYQFAGTECQFWNKSDKRISSLGITCYVYDADTKKNPLPGDNRLCLTYSGSIDPRETVPLIISLDPYIFAAPAKAFLLDFFCVSSIQYEDGSSWEDDDGTFFSRSY